MTNVASRCAPGAPPAVRQLMPVPRSAVLAFVVLLFSPAAFAGSVSATMNVSVSVIARAVLTISSEPSTVTVTDSDLARGYIDVATPIAMLLRTNSRTGCLLQVDSGSSTFSHVDLTFGDSAMSVYQQAWISRPYVPGGESLVMKVRVYFGADAQPGTYSLPLLFSARPL